MFRGKLALRRRSSAIQLAVLVSLGSSHAWADTAWQGTAGDWFNTSNWTLGIPAATDVATINNNANVTVGPGSAVALGIILGQTAPYEGLLELNGGTLTVGSAGITVGSNLPGTTGFLSLSTGIVDSGPLLINPSGTVVTYGGSWTLGSMTINGGSFKYLYADGSVNAGSPGPITIENGGIYNYSGPDVPNSEVDFPGPVTITGAGSRMIGPYFPNFTLDDNNNDGGFQVTNGGTLSTWELTVGNYSTNVSGSLSISGIGTNVNAMYEGSEGPFSVINQSGGSNIASQTIELSSSTGGNSTYNLSGGTVQTPNLYLGFFIYSTATFAISSTGSLAVSGIEYIGAGGMGTVNQTGGTNTVGGSLLIGPGRVNGEYVYITHPGNVGIYNLSSGTVQSPYISIGDGMGAGMGGTGTFNLSGTGMLTSPGFVLVGNNGGSGAVNQTGGTVNSGEGLEIGVDGGSVGEYWQGGGVNNANGGLAIAGVGQSLGEYDLSGGLLQGAGYETLGVGGLPPQSGGAYVSGGTATFNQTGGTNATRTLTVSQLPSVGVYDLSGGTLQAKDLFIAGGDGSSGTFNLCSTGSLSVSNSENVGAGGTGVFNQTGGTNIVEGSLVVGQDGADGEFPFVAYAANSGIYNFSGGTLQAQGVTIGNGAGPGTGATGTFIMSPGTTLNSTGGIFVGNNGGSGYFLQSSGTTVNLGYGLGIGVGDGSVGKYVQTGGLNSAANGLGISSGTGSVGEYDLSGGSIQGVPEEDISSGYYTNDTNGNQIIVSGGSGTFNQTGGSNTTGTLMVSALSGNGSYNLSNGSLQIDYLYLASGYGSMGIFNLSASGSLTVPKAAYVGAGGTGVFNQTGGTCIISGEFTVGMGSDFYRYPFVAYPGNSGAYNFSGGILEAQSVTVGTSLSAGEGGTGTFAISSTASLTSAGEEIVGTGGGSGLMVQSGTSTNSAEQLVIGFGPGSVGEYDLSGGSLQGGQSELLGTAIYDYNDPVYSVGGTGIIKQSGGVNTTETLVVAGESTSVGSYKLSGGSVQTGAFYVAYGGTGTFNLCGTGSLSSSYGELIGYSGNATFNQRGGTNTMPKNLNVGLDGIATYNLSGGVLSTPAIIMSGLPDDVSNFNLSGNVNLSVDSEFVGNYPLDPPGEIPDFRAGSGGTATFTQTGGTNTVNNLSIGGGTSNATYSLSAGTLNAQAIYVQPGGNFVQTGGTVACQTFSEGDGVSSAASVTIGAGNFSVTGITSVNSGTIEIDAGSANVSFGGGVFNNGQMVIRGGASFPEIGLPGIAGSGTLTVGALSAPAYVSLGSNFGSGGNSQSSIVVNAGSTLDIGNEPFVVDYGSAGNDPVQAIRQYLVAGYDKGDWRGNGLISGTAQEYLKQFSVGYADNTSTDQITIMLTVPGDTDLSGSTDFNDLTTVAQFFGQSIGKGNAVSWSTGDVNYDGQVDFNDLTIVAQFFGDSLTKAEAAELPASFVAQWDLARAEVRENSVPEPGGMGLMVVGSAGLMRRRRRGIAGTR